MSTSLLEVFTSNLPCFCAGNLPDAGTDADINLLDGFLTLNLPCFCAGNLPDAGTDADVTAEVTGDKASHVEQLHAMRVSFVGLHAQVHRTYTLSFAP